ncbi:MAG: TIR domain-containing protein [Oscillospiraceae bacterium]
MRVYILASQDKYSFAEKLLEDIRNAKIISRPLINEVIVEISSDIKKKVANADIILAIIDKNFTNNVMLNTEFQLVLMESRKNKNKLLLPIVLDDADIPVALESMLYVKCNSLSKEDIEKTKLKIKSVLEHRRYTVKTRNLKENQSRTSSMIILTLAIEMLAILFIVMFFKEGPFGAGYLDDENIITLSIGLIAVMLSITTLFTSYFSIMKRRWQEDDEEEIESYSRRLKRAIVPEEAIQDGQKGYRTEDTKKEIDALGRMMINLEDIKEFYTWSQKQAKASFILAVAMCISGFVLMIGAVMLPVVFRLSFEMSIIPAIGGVITELIAGTALVVYRNSLSQLNHYHKALHEDERFLSSVNLLGKFSTVEAQDDMLREIIRSEIQMNLAGLQENENMRSDKSSIKEDSK